MSLDELVTAVGALGVEGLLWLFVWECLGEFRVGVTGRCGDGVAGGTSAVSFSGLGERGVRGFWLCWGVALDCRIRKERRGWGCRFGG